jgi:hypothetical protein
MLHLARRRLRVLATAVLLSVCAVGGWSALGHELDHYDPDGAATFVVHDASAHAFRDAAPAAGDQPVHCVLCHWTRALGTHAQKVSLTLAVASRALAIHTADASLLHHVTAVQPPLRAPPAPHALDAFA